MATDGQTLTFLGRDYVYDGVTLNRWLIATGTGGTGSPVSSVNTKTGSVVLNSDDISDVGRANKWATQAELDNIATALANAATAQADADAANAGVSSNVSDITVNADATSVAQSTADSAVSAAAAAQSTANAAAPQDEATIIVDAGATAGTTRPTGWGAVQWIVDNGVTPTNAAASDLIFEREA